jgi:hypothetical protein
MPLLVPNRTASARMQQNPLERVAELSPEFLQCAGLAGQIGPHIEEWNDAIDHDIRSQIIRHHGSSSPVLTLQLSYLI